MCNMKAQFSVQYFCMNSKPAVSAAYLKHNDEDRTFENELSKSILLKPIPYQQGNVLMINFF